MHESVNVVVAVIAGEVAEPEVACEPDHPPLAVQLVTFELLHVSWVVAPDATETGFAVSETVSPLP